VVPTGEQVLAAYQAAPEVVQKLTVADKGSTHALNVLYITKPGPLDARVDMVHSLREDLRPPEGISATPSGLLVVGVGLLENLEANRVELTYLAIFLVFAFLTVRLRSVVRSLLSLVPVIIAVGGASLIAYIFDLKLSPMTAVGGPLVIAVCTEFTSLIILRFLEERARGLAPQAAADVTAARTGRAFMVSAMTAVAGVAVIATSSLPLLQDFGIIVAMNVVVALVCALVVLPPLMVWAENRGWVSKGMIDPAILAHATRTVDDPLGAGPGHRTAADDAEAST
jgi:predicted RND superfamily exporter protein